jgi:hypothetical protein
VYLEGALQSAISACGLAGLHFYRGHFEEMKYLITQVADVLQSGPFRFSHQRSAFRSVNALGAGLT